MRSSRENVLSLRVCDDRLTAMRLDNHVCLSDQFDPKDDRTVTLLLQKSDREKLLGAGSNAVPYPVMYSSEIMPGEIFIPEEVRKSLSIPLSKTITCELVEANSYGLSVAEEITFEIIDYKGSSQSSINISASEISEEIKAAFSLYSNQFPLAVDQVLVVPFKGGRLDLRVNTLFGAKSNNKETVVTRSLGRGTSIHFINKKSEKVHFIDYDAASDYDVPTIDSIPLDLMTKGVGGFKKEISRLRAVFYPRALNRPFLDAYGVKKHAKGILFYGPPGTGKTLIASAISKLFTKEPLIVIDGPQLKNSYYGATQQNLANLFSVAEQNPHKLYVYLFDELDALFGVRGSDNSAATSNNNDLVNRFCSILDGNQSPENIIVIGTTNRKELIDPALLRAGRLDTQIHIGLPSEEDRLEILQVHTNAMSKTLAADVDLEVIARLTRNYTGAELARLVRVATGYALEKNFYSKNNMLLFRPEIKTVEQAEKVTHELFLRAMHEVQPMFGVDESVLGKSGNDLVFYDKPLQLHITSLSEQIHSLGGMHPPRHLSILIDGGPGSGKSSLAAYLAEQSHFMHVQVLSASKLLQRTLSSQLEMIDDVFARALQSPEPSVIILENLENLIEATHDFDGYNNKLRLKLNEMLKLGGIMEKNILVIATGENSEFLHKIGLGNHFSESITLRPIRLDCRYPKEIVALLVKMTAGEKVGIINDLSPGQLDLRFDIPIKDLIFQVNKRIEGGVLKLSGFINGLPSHFRSPVTTVTTDCVPTSLRRVSK